MRLFRLFLKFDVLIPAINIMPMSKWIDFFFEKKNVSKQMIPHLKFNNSHHSIRWTTDLNFIQKSHLINCFDCEQHLVWTFFEAIIDQIIYNWNTFLEKKKLYPIFMIDEVSNVKHLRSWANEWTIRKFFIIGVWKDIMFI